MKDEVCADICMLCKKKKIEVNGKEYYPKKTLTFEAEKTLKLAVKMKNDEKLNVDIDDVDLK